MRKWNIIIHVTRGEETQQTFHQSNNKNSSRIRPRQQYVLFPPSSNDHIHIKSQHKCQWNCTDFNLTISFWKTKETICKNYVAIPLDELLQKWQKYSHSLQYLVPDMYMCTYMFEIIFFLQSIVCNVICYPLSFQMYIYIPPTLAQPILFDIKRSKRSRQPDKQTFLWKLVCTRFLSI